MNVRLGVQHLLSSLIFRSPNVGKRIGAKTNVEKKLLVVLGLTILMYLRIN